jgi:hypothetical protein
VLRRTLVGWAITIALEACAAPGPAPSVDPPAETTVIAGAVTTARALDLLTETTLRCQAAADRHGLAAWICTGEDGTATLEVTILAEDQSIHVIDARVVPGSGVIVDYVPFFRETVIGRLAPGLAADPRITSWLQASLDERSSLDLPGARLATAVAYGRIRLVVIGQRQ